MALSGKDGTVTLGTVDVPVTKWDLTVDAEVSKFGVGGFKNAIGGVVDVKGSFECVDMPTGTTPGTPIASISLKESATGNTYSGKAVIKSKKVTVVPDTGEVIKYTIEFEGDGAWTGV